MKERIPFMLGRRSCAHYHRINFTVIFSHDAFKVKIRDFMQVTISTQLVLKKPIQSNSLCGLCSVSAGCQFLVNAGKCQEALVTRSLLHVLSFIFHLSFTSFSHRIILFSLKYTCPAACSLWLISNEHL